MQTSVKDISKKFSFVSICVRTKANYAFVNQTYVVNSPKI